MSLMFNTSDFTASRLTTRANDAERIPFIETQARRLFREEPIIGETAQVDREQFGTTLLPSVAKGTTAGAQASTRSRQTTPVNAIKVGDRLVITPTQIANVRQTGLQAGQEVALESFNSLVDKGLAEKFANVDHTIEYLCMTTILGTTIDPTDQSTIAINYPTLFSVSQPAYVDLLLREASPEEGALRARFHTALTNIRNNLGGIVPTGYIAFYAPDAWGDFQAHPELRDAFRRMDDGSFLSSSSFGGVRFAGIEHVEYRGPGLAAGEVVIVPTGVSGMLDLFYASGDKLPFVNELGQPRYVVPRNEDDPFQLFGEGAEWEIASRVVPVNLRPEAVQRCYADNTTV